VITVHHLNNSRSQRVLWLLEELGIDYRVERYERDAKTMLAPASLKNVHPLGKSPVISDGERVVAETGAIIEYLVERHGNGRLAPAAGSDARLRYSYWLHYAEGSLMPLMVMTLIFNRIVPGSPMLIRPIAAGIVKAVHRQFLGPNTRLHLDYVESELGRSTWFAGEDLPRGFFDDWVSVGDDEARHFTMLQARLATLGARYGDLPAHDGLWQAAEETRHDLMARLAVVPMVLEARGLDVTPAMIGRLRGAGDHESAHVLETIYTEEQAHVSAGGRWFAFLCAKHGEDAKASFHRLVRRHFRGALKPPFNRPAREAAGLPPEFYEPLAAGPARSCAEENGEAQYGE
jgi:glutathione S-transferase